MKTHRRFIMGSLFFLFLSVCLALHGAGRAYASEDAQSFRSTFNLMLDKYEVVFQRINNAEGLKLVSDARTAMQGVSDEQLVKVFGGSGFPQLSEAVKAAETLVAVTPAAPPFAKAETAPAQLESVPFPVAQPILSECNNIAHSSSFKFGALIAFEIARGLLAAAEFGCQQMVVILGEGANGSAVCIPLAIAKDAAEIPFELADFCSGEEDSALLQASYERLEHLHNDLMDAQTALINNSNTNTSNIINNDNSNRETIITNANTNTSSIISNDNSNREAIIANDNANTTSIINNDNANTTNIVNNDNHNKDLIISELRALGCEIVRLLNTPEGQRASSILACTGSPKFPYNWPSK